MEAFLCILIVGAAIVVVVSKEVGRVGELCCYLLLFGMLSTIATGVELGWNPKGSSIEKASPEELALYRLSIQSGMFTPLRQKIIEACVAEDFPVQEGALSRAINNTMNTRWARDWRCVNHFVRNPSLAIDYVKQHGLGTPPDWLKSYALLPSRGLDAIKRGERPLQAWSLLAMGIAGFTFFVRFAMLSLNNKKGTLNFSPSFK